MSYESADAIALKNNKLDKPQSRERRSCLSERWIS